MFAKTNFVRNLSAYFALLLLLAWLPFAHAQGMTINVELDANSNLYPLSIQAFTAENSGLSSPITPTIKNDLSVSAAFNFVDASAAKSTATGSVEAIADGKYRVHFSLKDAAQKELTSGEFIIRPNQARDTAHTIADMIYRALTGFPGIFNSKIAYVRHSGSTYLLQVADVDGGRPLTVLRSHQPIMSPAWSPDGSKLAYVSFEAEKPVIWVQDLSSGQRHVLSNFKGSNSAPSWSPNGQQLAVTLTLNGNSQIYLINANGNSQPKLITSSQSIDTESTWSHDGRSLLFVSDRSGNPQIYRVFTSDGKVERLTYKGIYNVSPKISPSGKSFTYIRRSNGRFRVMLQDFASGYARPLSENSYNERPSFAPNGQVVLYASDVKGKSVLYAVSVSSGARAKLGVLDGEIQDPAWGPVNQ